MTPEAAARPVIALPIVTVVVIVVRVCAWCRRFLGLKRPLDRWDMIHSICALCEPRLTAPRPPSVTEPPPTRILIVSADPMGLDAAGQLIARAGDSVLTIADRRHSDRRDRRSRFSGDERRRADRRAPPPATWDRGYVLIESDSEQEVARLAFARVVHRDSEWSRIPLLAVTALVGVADYISTWATGFAGHLTKPVEQEEPVASIPRVPRGGSFPPHETAASPIPPPTPAAWRPKAAPP